MALVRVFVWAAAQTSAMGQQLQLLPLLYGCRRLGSSGELANHMTGRRPAILFLTVGML